MKSPAKINRMWEIIVFHKIGVGLTQIESMKKSL